jgi:hypothetical protein
MPLIKRCSSSVDLVSSGSLDRELEQVLRKQIGIARAGESSVKREEPERR